MKSHRYARLVAEVLKRAEPRPSELPSVYSNQDEEIALIEQAMDRRRRRARGLRVLAWGSVAAALMLGAGVGRIVNARTSSSHTASKAAESKDRSGVAPVAIAIASGSGAIVAAPGLTSPVVAGRSLQAGSRLIVDPSAGAILSLSTGTLMEVEPGSQLLVVEDSRAQIFALHSGSLRADVAKLGPDERFLVRTVDAEVEVRGTSFLVDVVASDPACGAGNTTRVTVFEGTVAVRAEGQEASIGKGEQWPRGCRNPPPPRGSDATKRAAKTEVAARVPDAAPSADLAPGAASLPGRAGAVRNSSSSTLAEENDLFAQGVLARRQGNLPLALDKMDRLLERFPASRLAENAIAERMRMLRTIDPWRAAQTARHYLQRYPNGFAHAEAKAILAAAP